jgi:tetratricopeptide (TPR) repeat protein
LFCFQAAQNTRKFGFKNRAAAILFRKGVNTNSNKCRIEHLINAIFILPLDENGVVKKLLLILLTGLIYSVVQAQDVRRLRAELYRETGNRIQLAAKLRDIFLDESVDSLFSLGKYLLHEGIYGEDNTMLHYGKLTLAGYYNHMGKTELSIPYLYDCIAYYRRRGDDEKLADAQNLMGLAHLYNTAYNEAGSWFLKSIETSRKLGKDNESYMAQVNLTELYFREGKLELAESEINSFIAKVRRQNLLKGLKKGYDLLGKIYMQQGKTELAIDYYNKALELAIRNGDKAGKANAFNNSAIASFETGNTTQAYQYFEKALDLRLQINKPVGISESYYNLGDWNFYQGNLSEALAFYRQSLEIAQKNHLITETADACKMLAETYKLMGRYKDAVAYLEQQLEQTNFMRRQNQAQEKDLQLMARDLESSEQQLNQRQRERRLQQRLDRQASLIRMLLYGLGGLLLVGAGIYFLVRRKSTPSSAVADR